MEKVILLAGLPTGFVKYVLDRGFDSITFEEWSIEKLKEVLNKADRIVIAIRHKPTIDLVLQLIENKEKIEMKEIVENEELLEADRVIIAPKKLTKRGKDIEVNWEDLVIIAFYPAFRR